MDSMCRETIEKINILVTKGLQPEQQRDIDQHLNRCPACLKYLLEIRSDDKRLAGLAESLKASVTLIEKGVMDALESDVEMKPVVKISMWRSMMKRRVLGYAAVVIIIVGLLWGLNHFTGWFGGTSPVFADVLEKIKKAHSVIYLQSFEVEGEDPFTVEVMVAQSGIMRTVLSDGNIIVNDFHGGKDLQLMTNAKKAIITQRVGRPRGKSLFNYLDWLQTLHKHFATFMGKEKIEGRDSNLFVLEKDQFEKFTVWVDAATDLPIKIEHTMIPNLEKGIIVPEITLSEGDFGGDKNNTRKIGISGRGGITKRSKMVYENFQWNVDLDPSLFSLEPPEGYTVAESKLDDSYKGEKDLVEALTIWATMSKKSFPADIDDLNDPNKVKPLLINRFDGDGDPQEELEEALKVAHKFLKGLMFVQQLKVDGSWHYAGDGVMFGNAETAVCWWKPKDSDTYRVVYGDLRIEDIESDELPKLSRRK